MALTRTMLKAMGIEDEKIEQIISAHSETVDGLKSELTRLKDDSDKLQIVQKELDALKAQPDDGYKDKYTKIKAEYDKFKADTEAAAALEAKKAAYTEVCKDAGLNEKGVAKALKYADWDAVELDDAGKVKDAKNHIKALKEEWAEHVATTRTTGATTPNPPANTGATIKSREELYKTDDRGRFILSASERQAALSQIIAAEQQKG